MKVAKRLSDHAGPDQEIHPFGYPSKHLAENALCRWFDNGEISFSQWETAKVVKHHDGKFYVVNNI